MLKQFVVSTALTLMVVAAAHADSFNARLAQQCPTTMAWVQAHTSRERAEKKWKAYDATHHFGEPVLRQELTARYMKDQKVREKWTASNYSKASGKAMMAVDADNLAWLKPLIAKHGFPTLAQVGYAGVSHAWTLVQHATRDPALQAHVLHEIVPLLKTGEISKNEYALLRDRLRVEQGKPQIYGTQFFIPNGKNGKLMTHKNGTPNMQLRPLQDPAHVDQRRASMGLMPLADYECMLQVMYTPAANPQHSTGNTSKQTLQHD